MAFNRFTLKRQDRHAPPDYSVEDRPSGLLLWIVGAWIVLIAVAVLLVVLWP